MTIEELESMVGQILYVRGNTISWMFKLLKIIKVESGYVDIMTIYGFDVYPEFKNYCSNPCKPHFEKIELKKIRIPTKKELNIFREKTRKVRLLGKNYVRTP